MKEESLFVAALEKYSATERQAFLDEACGGDVGLRQRVEQLLAADDSARGVLPRDADGAPLLSLQNAIAEGPGTVIGPYKLKELIGEGGFGLVFVAEQQQPVRRKVALKIIKPGMDTRDVSARFEAERQALALMDHPSIARIFDAGSTASGRPYFVMELVRGVAINEYCDQQQLTTRERLELFTAVCHAVQHAHQKGVIHRDLKPSNILVALHDSKPVPKVIDFGVAKALNQQLTEHSIYTRFAQMVGTPAYMSPEQAKLSGLDVDTRSDIYSLGVMLYELLTGSTPFDKKRLATVGFDEMRRIIREEEPEKPSTRLSHSKDTLVSLAAQRRTEPAKLKRLMRGELDWIVMKALEKDRTRRYETASDLARDVHRYLRDEPVEASPPSTLYRLRKLVRRNKGSLAVAAVVFLAVTVMAASISWAVRDRMARAAEIEQAETARRATVEGQVRDSLNMARALIAESKLASAREKLAQARVQLGNDLAALGNLAAEVAASETDLDRFQQFLDLIDEAHQAETAPLLEATLAADGSRGSAVTPVSAKTGDRRPAAAVPFLLEALQRYHVMERDDWTSNLEGGLLGKPQVEQIRRLAYEELLWLATDVSLRQQEHRSGQKLSPQAAIRQALVYLSKAESAQQPTQALYALRARCRKAVGEEAAAQADSQLADTTPPTMALDHSLRGRAAYDAKQLAEGVQAFEAALRLEPTHYWSLMWLGCCLCDLGQGPEDFAGAARVFTGCILKRPDHAHGYHCRANAYARLRRREEAVADYSKAIELDPQHTDAWFNRGNTLKKLGQPDKALADYSKAIELDPEYALAWMNRGSTYLKLGQPDKAVADSSKAIELDPKHARAWSNRGAAYNKLGQPDKALADFSRAIELDPQDANIWYNRGTAYHKLGQPDKALIDYSQAIELDPQHAYFWYNRGSTYYAMGQPDKARNDLSRAIELDPKAAHAWFNRGLAHHKLAQHEMAVADYSKFIELAPNHLELCQAYLMRGHANSRLAHFEQARTDYQTFLKREPTHAEAHNLLAWLLATCPDANLRDPDQAVELAKKAVQLGPKVANYWRTLGAAHYRAGDWKAAVAALDKSVDLGPRGDAGDQLFLAMVHRRLGNYDKARKAYEQAKEWLEKNQEALEKADKGRAEELRRFRAEAEEVLELKKEKEGPESADYCG